MAINAINLKSVRVAGNLDEINSKQFIMRSHLQNLHVLPPRVQHGIPATMVIFYESQTPKTHPCPEFWLYFVNPDISMD